MENFEKTAAICALTVGLGLSMALFLTLSVIGEAPDKRGEYATAFKESRPLMHKGSDFAENSLSLIYESGWDVQPDVSGAGKWNRNATEQRNTDAQAKLDSMYLMGRTVVKNSPPLAAGGDFRVQLVSVTTKPRAVREAARLSRAHKSVLGKLKIALVRADLGRRGVFYRLRAGPFRDRTSANALCRKLSARKQRCFVIKP